MSRFVAIDLAQLPPIDAVVPPDAELIVAQRKLTLLALIADPALRAEVQAVLRLESEPLVKQNEVGAIRELIHFQRVNEAVRAEMLATTSGNNLDNMVARLNVQRMPGESDAELKYRYQLKPEAFSVAGPAGAYEFHARSAHPDVLDAACYGPESGLVTPGQTLTVILSRLGDGTPSREITDAVYARLSHEDTVPDTDQVLVRGAVITPYAIRYRLQVRPGADVSLIVKQARARLTAYAATDDAYVAAVDAGYVGTEAQFRNLPPEDGGINPRRVGGIIALSAIDGAAHQDRINVVRAPRISPAAEVNPGLDGAVWCTSVAVEYEVVA